MNLPGEQPPNIFTSFVRTRFRLMSCLIRKANCPTMSKQCNRVVQVSRFGDPDVIEVVDTPPADGRPRRGARPRARFECRVHGRDNPAPHLRANGGRPTTVRSWL